MTEEDEEDEEEDEDEDGCECDREEDDVKDEEFDPDFGVNSGGLEFVFAFDSDADGEGDGVRDDRVDAGVNGRVVTAAANCLFTENKFLELVGSEPAICMASVRIFICAVRRAALSTRQQFGLDPMTLYG